MHSLFPSGFAAGFAVKVVEVVFREDLVESFTAAGFFEVTEGDAKGDNILELQVLLIGGGVTGGKVCLAEVVHWKRWNA
jgi:hypothetical protein